jgi:hypothetical protein
MIHHSDNEGSTHLWNVGRRSSTRLLDAISQKALILINSSSLMGPFGLLPCSQEPVSWLPSTHYFKIRFNSFRTFSSSIRMCIRSGLFLPRFRLKYRYMNFSSHSGMCYMSSPFHPPWFDHRSVSCDLNYDVPVTFEVHTALRMAMLFSAVTPYRLVGRYQRFGESILSRSSALRQYLRI